MRLDEAPFARRRWFSRGCGLNGYEEPAMSTLLTAILAFIGGVLTTRGALLAFTAWATRDLKELERKCYEAQGWEKGDPYPRGPDGSDKGACDLGHQTALRLSLRS
jgi:hypothetical protein